MVAAPEPGRNQRGTRVCDNRRWTTSEGDRPGAGGVVAGSDVNEGMLEVAAATATALPVRIEWHRADATALPLPDGAFDVVCCQQGLQLGAPLAALDEEPRWALARELDQTLGEWADDDGLVFPMQTWLATARR
jgi:23S rRNA G2445 N2-methylase RlmL